MKKEVVGTENEYFRFLEYKREGRRSYLLVECKTCGNITWMRADVLDSAKSCCLYKKKRFAAMDLTKIQVPGSRLTPIRPTEKRIKNSVVWEYKCSCGKTTFVPTTYYLKGETLSCGCLRREFLRENNIRRAIEETNKGVIDGTNVRNLISNTPKNNTSGRKGVSWITAKSKWRAQIVFKGKSYHLGYYLEKEDAIKAREAAEKALFDNFLEWYALEFPEQWAKIKGEKDKSWLPNGNFV